MPRTIQKKSQLKNFPLRANPITHNSLQEGLGLFAVGEPLEGPRRYGQRCNEDRFTYSLPRSAIQFQQTRYEWKIDRGMTPFTHRSCRRLLAFRRPYRLCIDILYLCCIAWRQSLLSINIKDTFRACQTGEPRLYLVYASTAKSSGARARGVERDWGLHFHLHTSRTRLFAASNICLLWSLHGSRTGHNAYIKAVLPLDAKILLMIQQPCIHDDADI